MGEGGLIRKFILPTTVASVHFTCIIFREICGQKVASLATSCTSMPAWKVKCMMLLNGQLVRYENCKNATFSDLFHHNTGCFNLGSINLLASS